MNYLVKAIQKLHPEAEFSMIDDDLSTIKWDVLEGAAPTQKEIDETIDQIKAEEAIAQEQLTTKKTALLARLGITEDEAKALLA